MIKFKRFTLDNGLRVIVHEDNSTPLAAMNLLYDVGSRDEDPALTGLAHLFEHLMFSGTKKIPDFDRPLQVAGGENNAFTNNDITNYFLTVPAQNIETAFWLESDRMTGLNFSQKNLETQKHVVIEEFNQRYLNQPYGDSMLNLRPLAYKVHPYRWPAIGKDLSHIAGINLKNIKDFFYSHYAPNNAILTLTGNITSDKALELTEKWFGPVPERQLAVRNIQEEPKQNEARELVIEADVPADAIYKVWHVCERKDPSFHTLDVLTDLLAGGESGRLYTRLVRDLKMFSEINAYLTADMDPGLIILHGKLMKETELPEAERAIREVIGSLLETTDYEPEMEKVRNKFEASTVFSHTNILNKAINLAHFELLGDPELINSEADMYRNVTSGMVREAAEKYMDEGNCSTLFYKSNRKNN
jgi:zinc protease